MSEDPFNLTDIHKKPTGKNGAKIVTGFLVVGVKKTEAELVAAYGGEQVPSTQPIIFEDADGKVETGNAQDSAP